MLMLRELLVRQRVAERPQGALVRREIKITIQSANA